MPRKPQQPPIVCQYFTWRFFVREGVFYADGRGGRFALGKHSLGTRDREEALARLRELDLQKAVDGGLADIKTKTVGEMIPIVGPVLAAIPAVAVAATVSFKKVLLVIVFFVVQQQIENHVLVPKVMERQVGVSALTVIVALLIGGKLLGIPGAILAVPTAAILQVLFTEWMNTRDSDKA